MSISLLNGCGRTGEIDSAYGPYPDATAKNEAELENGAELKTGAAELGEVFLNIPVKTGDGYGKYAVKTEVVYVDNQAIHHLSDDAVCASPAIAGESIDYEGLFGLKVHCDGTRVEYTMYSYNSNYTEGTVSVEPGFDRTYDDSAVSLGKISKGETGTFDICDAIKALGMSRSEGVYRLELKSGEDPVLTTRMYLYYDGTGVGTCRCNGNGTYEIDRWNEAIGDCDPDKCLAMYMGDPSIPITYPTSGTGDNCNHVQEWCDLSDTIIKDEKWSDDLKVYALVNYLARNYAYDDYRVNTLHNASRATNKGVWSDDNLWMYYNKVGQCWDCANVLTIMCRHQGIPCTSAENDGHTVNAVWLHDEWTAIDVSVLLAHHCYTEDTDPANWRAERHGTFDRDYGYFDYSMHDHNQCIATPETTLEGGEGNPR